MIEETIQQILTKTKPAAANLWIDEASFYFCRTEEWSKADIFIRNEPACQLELKAIVSPAVQSLVNLRNLQQRIWLRLANPYFESSSVTFYSEASVLRFVTVDSQQNSLTGRMIVGGDHYYELVRTKGSQRYADREQALPALPPAPFQIDFADLDHTLIGSEEARKDWRTRNIAEQEKRIERICRTAEQINFYISSRKESDLSAPLVREAILFNLESVWRQSHYFKVSLYKGVKDWCNQVRKRPGFENNFDAMPDALIWDLCINEVPQLLKLINTHTLYN